MVYEKIEEELDFLENNSVDGNAKVVIDSIYEVVVSIVKIHKINMNDDLGVSMKV